MYAPGLMGAPRREDRLLGGLYGSLVGDALGVPVEFSERARRDADPVIEMRGLGTWNQRPGTWSGDGVGYVIETLEASMWCLLRAKDYASATLAAVNLGGDTDTTGCVTGGLAGLVYGVHGISREWREALPRRVDLEELFRRFARCE